LQEAAEEDGLDLTTRSFSEQTPVVAAKIRAKEEGVFAGGPALALGAKLYGLRVELKKKEGTLLAPGKEVATLWGRAGQLFSAERPLLNILGRLCGIATLTKQYVEAFRPVRVYDTRKTLPGWRSLEKYAVRVGGGSNHRLGLHDQLLFKDNHLRLWGTERLAEAVTLARRKWPGLGIEVEAQSWEDLKQAVAVKPDLIMLDNWRCSELPRAVEFVREELGDAVQIEVSGGVKLEDANFLRALSIDRVAVGALTHSARSLDLSLEVVGSGAPEGK